MKKVPLGDIGNLPAFENGMSLASYQRIGRLIREHGPNVKVNLDLAGDIHGNLIKALDEVEKGVQATKHKIISQILDNPTYTLESGVWCRLYNVLSKLSKDDLGTLKLVIDQKEPKEKASPS